MIKLIKSTFYNEPETKKKLAEFILNAEFLSFGSECEKFEKNFAEYQERKQCVFFSSGSTANFALVQALKNLGRIAAGDVAGFSAVTWSTNVMPLLQLGIEAIPVDVELDTLNTSSKQFVKLPLSTKLFFITNLLGLCDDIENVAEICKEKNIILIEDNCESLGTVYKKKKLGNYGLASTFSFFVGHHMSTIEGGAVCTDDEELSVMLRLVRAHGWDRNLSHEHQDVMRKKHDVVSPFHGKYTFYDLGNNFRPTEINGFLGNDQLGYMDEIVEKRNTNFKKFAHAIYGNTEKYYPVRYDHIHFVSNFAFPVVCKSEKVKDTLVKRCEDKVEIRPIVGGDMTQQPFFAKYKNGFSNYYNTTNANIIHRQALYFGNNPELTEKEIETIIKTFA